MCPCVPLTLTTFQATVGLFIAMFNRLLSSIGHDFLAEVGGNRTPDHSSPVIAIINEPTAARDEDEQHWYTQAKVSPSVCTDA